ncbi:MAG: FAD-dependent oxidoreductase [Sphingobacteriales bacterium]|nr:MAG: FAD-dependent oxidoreductase [Sphingobacteriales bacterium]
MRNIFLIILLFVVANTHAQNKVDVLVLGASAAGAACAIQAARSAEGAPGGLKIMLIEASENLLSGVNPTFNEPAYDSGIWKEWQEAYHLSNDTLKNGKIKMAKVSELRFFKNTAVKTNAQNTLQQIVKNLKNLTFHKNTQVLGIVAKKNGWVVKVLLNGLIQEIKTKILVDATEYAHVSPLSKYGIIKLSDEGKINSLVTYSPIEPNKNIYRTSIGAGTNGTALYYFPAGMFIPLGKENLMVITAQTNTVGFDKNAFNNIALQLSLGQGAGVLAAYAPFFGIALKDANVRVLQSEVLNYKGQLLPIKDVAVQDSAYKALQQVIISGFFKLNMDNGLFYPDSLVSMNEIKPIMNELYTRSKIWYLENTTAVLNLENIIALISFISAREVIDISPEISSKWNKKYGFNTPFDIKKPLTRKQFALVVNDYLQPYKVRVNFNGDFLK